LERLEKRRPEIEAKGARIAAVSVDAVDVSQQLALDLGLGFPLLSDDKGDLIKAYGVWEEEHGIAIPAIVVIDRQGIIRWRRVSDSITDRPDEDIVIDIVGRLPR
jgi:peroxiredoxin